VYERPLTVLAISSVYIFCDFGSIDELDDHRGAAHFIEHCVFKGTQKMPKSKELYMEYDKVGALYNANTTKRYTSYNMKCRDEDVAHCIYRMSDMLFHSIFPAREIKKEEQVVIEENISNSNSGDILSSDMMDSMLYTGTPFAEPVDTITYHHHDRTFQRKTIVDVYRRHYQPCNMVISVVSHIPFSQIISILEKSAFSVGSTKTVLLTNRIFAIPSRVQCIQYEMNIMKGGHSSYMNIGFRTCNHDSKDKHVLNLLKHAMSGSFSSRMFTVLREEHGLTYSSNASTHYCEIGGEFVFYAESDPKKVIRNGGTNTLGVLPLLIRMIRSLIRDGISKKELAFIKQTLLGKITISLENIDQLAEHNGVEYLVHNYRDSSKLVTRSRIFETYYEPITTADIKAVIARYFRPEFMCVSIVGGSTLPPLATVKRICESAFA
jgi:hypothetical protein